MPDEVPFDDELQPTPSNGEGEIPASVTFMEIMRQAAAKASPRTAPAASSPPLKARAVTAPTPEAEPVKPPTPPSVPAQRTARQRDPMEEQRVLRVKRRRARRRRQTVGVLGGIIRSVIVILMVSVLMATLFSWSMPTDFINREVRSELGLAQATPRATVFPTPIPTPNWLRRIGIVSGHRGPQQPPDPGAVCPDGLTEAEINFAVAQFVVRNLRAQGYSVDLLDEFDPRLDGYQAAALVSIHANTCQDFGEPVSGFMIARAAARTSVGADDILVECVARKYEPATGLDRRFELTIDMTDYHSFREIHPLTPAAIIELGFMLGDRDVLVNRQEEMAQAITEGVVCFLQPDLTQGTPAPPTVTPISLTTTPG
jgi:N-acetylmuramoyl-L-alanine amidase